MNKNILQNLKDTIPELTYAQKKVADYILKNPSEVAFLTIEQLSALVDTSTSTIMRLAFSLNYSGYTDLQKDLQKLIRNRIAPSSRFDTNIKTLEKSNLLTKLLNQQINNINSTAKMLSDDVLMNSIEMILSAKTVYCAGVRTSFPIAHFLYHGLSRSLGNCELIFSFNGDLPEKVIKVTEEDLVIAITLPRYAKATTDFVRMARSNGARIIGITDGYSSPIANYSDIILPFNYSSLSFHSSIIGGIFIADYIITEITIRQPEKTRERLKQLENIFEDWDSVIYE